MLRTLLMFLAALMAAACTPLEARTLVDVSVVDRDNGQWLEPVRNRGQYWIAGTPGHRYSVRLTNTTGRHVLVVLSVDGINAVTGQTAHPSQTGYVLGPWQSSEIQGWRKSMDEVAQFVFTDLPDSYAARTGRPDNVGVIGVAVFEEAPTWYDDSPAIARNEGKAASPAAEAAADGARQSAPQSMGTGHGAREWSQASRTEFERATRTPAQISEIRYDDVESLVARGVMRPYPRYRWTSPPDRPRAFPDGFVADPPGDH
jgi:hypothetical protein